MHTMPCGCRVPFGRLVVAACGSSICLWQAWYPNELQGLPGLSCVAVACLLSLLYNPSTDVFVVYARYATIWVWCCCFPVVFNNL